MASKKNLAIGALGIFTGLLDMKRNYLANKMSAFPRRYYTANYNIDFHIEQIKMQIIAALERLPERDLQEIVDSVKKLE